MWYVSDRFLRKLYLKAFRPIGLVFYCLLSFAASAAISGCAEPPQLTMEHSPTTARVQVLAKMAGEYSTYNLRH